MDKNVSLLKYMIYMGKKIKEINESNSKRIILILIYDW